MPDLQNKRAYQARFEELSAQLPPDVAMQRIVGGGDYHKMGLIEALILCHFGLSGGHYLIDVGCGSGRLAANLVSRDIRYLGIDVIPQVLDHARLQCQRDDWRFEEVEGFAVPEADGAADMVCAFSLLTHLLPEQSYMYLADMARVLRPGGTLVMSYLDFAVTAHRKLFLAHVGNFENIKTLNVFTDKAAIDFWAEDLGLEIVSRIDGDQPILHVDGEVTTLDGGRLGGPIRLGQSLCVLRRN